MSVPDIVILCGGMGTRLRSVVQDVPKPMASVAGRPFLEILLSWFQEFGRLKVVLSTGYLARAIYDHFGESFGHVTLRYAVDPEPLGTGGAARAGARLCDSNTVLICNGDTFLDFDLLSAAALCADTGEPVVIVTPVPDTERYGRIEFEGPSLANFHGRGVSGEGFISGGIYLLPRLMLTRDDRPDPFSLEDFVFDPKNPRRTHAFLAEGRFIDIGIPKDYEKAQTMFGRAG